ncbi:nucleolar and spindle-associated protein 1 isoform X2 [Salmo salar]|uniref:Nucleolar and spindle-associated protein 1 isoform X2 n=1 Tax=Salmo salar TaxID=8030 RepID=A0A1S3SS67_SALSA|nr:nucleolar and spindle-associated protein 1-like isoform X2 [Salmo salar]|eukprot:XP_014067188.1 PREDICTED: nucleolar and spindle-associated protein 1-like isoform X2 [Salmo salar]
MDLDSMKYVELRSLAKEVGLKSSKLKAEKLLKALREHFQQQQTQEDVAVDGDETGVDAQDNKVKSNSTQDENNSALVDELSPKPSAQEFVTKRRGRGQPKMRKEFEDEEAEGEPAKAPLTPAEVVNKVTESIIGKGSAKRRRVSAAAKDSGVAVPEHKVAAVMFGVGQKVVKPVGKIPRHEGLLKRTKSMLKPTTPNFRKLHEAHFKRMESIDSYVERKTKKIDSFRNSVNELKVLSDKTLLTPTEGKTQASSTSSRASLFSPVSQKQATDRRRLTQVSASKPATDKRRLSARKPPKKETVVPFRPTVLFTRRINVRFSQATQDNEHKKTMVKTPARMATRVDLLTPGKESTFGGRLDVNKTFVLSSAKTPAFVFNANTSVLSNCPETNKKTNFDLKASLSKTLTYKPHKGKLKPFMVAKENTVDQSQTVSSHQKNYKQHPVQAREERRTKQTEVRKQKKEKMLGARRGLIIT